MENTPKKILIVEDDTSLLNAMKDKFSREGFEVLEASNGEEGLKNALGNHPDLILLDIMMPVMDGMQMLKKLREDSWGKTVSVIILTNLNDQAKISEAMENETFDYLVKNDWPLEKIVERVREKLTKGI